MSGSTKAITAAALLLASGSGATAQMGASHRPEDVATPEAIVAASYEAISRRPGEEFDWDRVISLFLPSARLIPNTEQTGGEFLAMSPQEFRRWVEESYAENAPIGGPDDRGFQEEQIHAVVERYGDIAHVLSTYRTRYWGAEEILGRGINSFQLVRHDGRWWIAGIVWDEEGGAGPIPTGYLPGTTERANDAGAAESEIADLIEEVEAANNAGDVERWVGLFAEGAVYMPPGAPAVTTREGLREVARAGFRNRTSIDIEPLEIRVFGDWAFARSRVTGSVTLRDSGEVVHIDMKQIVIYARDGNGRWRMARLIGNSNG